MPNYNFSKTEKELRKLYYKDALQFIKDRAREGHRIIPQGEFFVFQTYHNGAAIRLRYLWVELYGEKSMEEYKKRQDLLDKRNKEISSRMAQEGRESLKQATGEDLNEDDDDVVSETPVILDSTGQNPINKGKKPLDIW